MAVQFLPDPGMPGPAPAAAVAPATPASAVFVRLLFHGLLVGVIAVFGAVLFREFSYVYSLRATVMGDIVQIKSPDPGIIVAVHVKDGDEVAAGTPLFELDDTAFQNRLTILKRIHERLADEIAVAAARIEEYKAHSEIARQMNLVRRKLIQAQIDSRQAQIDLANNNHTRTSKLRAAAVSHQEADTNMFEVDQQIAQLEVLKVEMDLQEKIIQQSRNNRMFSGQERTFAGFTIRNDVIVAQSEHTRKKTELEQIALQIVECETQIARCKIKSRVAGHVKHVNRLAGDHVTSNDYVLSILGGNSKLFVAARFTSEDTKYLAIGTDCTIVFPARNQTVIGTVTSIGHGGLNASGTVSIDEETSLAEVPVKIALPDGVDLRGGEGAHVKARRNWSLSSWLQKLY